LGEVHQLLLELGKAAALKAVDERDVVEAAAAYLSSEDSEIGFIYSGWAQAALPHKRLADDAVWEIKTERMGLLVQPGLRMVQDGPSVPIGVPYGSRARLILLYLQSEALRTGRREIELGRSLRVWLGRLGIAIGGKSMREVRDQAERLSYCRLSFQLFQGAKTGLVNQLILDEAMFDSEQGREGRFIERAKLSETFFQQLKRHPVPVAEAAVRQLANNSLSLDIYCWLAYRLHSLGGPVTVSWHALHGQFGRGVKRLDNFRTCFRRPLALALAVYPDARVEFDERGLVLHPSRPPIGKGHSLGRT
jgi:hypothetical protein